MAFPSVGSVAARSEAAVRVLSRHDIDFCCGGARPFDATCLAAGLSPDAILGEIAREEVADPTPGAGWATRPLEDLVEHLLEYHHARLRVEVPRLLSLARKVAVVHEARDGARLGRLLSVFGALGDELLGHMQKEEQILFPWILSGTSGADAGGPIRVMQAEHEAASRSLAEIRFLTDDFTPPEGACLSWIALLEGLAAFDADLRVHIHLENNVLFPRALAA